MTQRTFIGHALGDLAGIKAAETSHEADLAAVVAGKRLVEAGAHVAFDVGAKATIVAELYARDSRAT